MTLVLTDEQEELRSSVRKVIGAKCPMERVRSFVAGGGVDQPQDLWTAMAQQMGLAGIAIPDKYGGTGSGIREAAVVTEELGRSLAVTPFLSSIVLGGQALLALDDETARQDYLPSIADGSVRMTYAWSDHDPTSKSGVRSGPAGLTGTVPFALDGMTADHIVVETVDAGGDRVPSRLDRRAGTHPDGTRQRRPDTVGRPPRLRRDTVATVEVDRP